MSRSVQLLATLVTTSLLLASCRDRSPLAPGGQASTTEFGTGAVRLALRQAPGPQPGQVTYTLRLVQNGVRVGAYQGALTFAPGALEVVDAQAAAAPDGEAHLLNAERASEGVIRFAAYSAEGLSGEEVLQLVVRPRGRRVNPNLAATLDAVSDASGATLWQQSEPTSELPSGVQAFMYPNAVGPAYLAFNAGSAAAAEVEPGAKLAVPLIIDLSAAGGLSLASLQTQVTWAPERLSFDSLRTNTALGWTFTPNIAGAPSGSVAFTTSAAAPLAATSTLATAHFTAIGTGGGTTLRLTPGAAANAQSVSVLPDLRPRALALCVAPIGRWGDANADGVVNIIDSQQLARHGVGLSVLNLSATLARGDVTADAAVNIIDAQQVARFSVGLSAAARTNTLRYTVPPTNTVTLTPAASQYLGVGGSQQLSAAALDGSGVDQTGCATVNWTSTNTGVATVNASGLVSALSPGTATITATSGTASANLVVNVSGLPAPSLPALAIGTYHSCDLNGAGLAYCWGGNEYGQLGDGSFTDRDRPVAVAGGRTFTSLTASRRHTCGLAGDGSAWCWGSAEYGVLGNGATSGGQNTPVQVSGGLQFSQLVAGQDHTCGLTTAGAVYCWGRNLYGELGDGTQTQRLAPTLVLGGLAYTGLAAGVHHTCAVTSARAAYCWGDNRAGQLGDGTTTDLRPLPTLVAGDHVWTQISAGVYSSCGLLANGTARCWGSNTFGQLGDGSIVDRTSPVLVNGGLAFTKIYAGDTSCGLTAAGAAWCWGLNGQGQIGDGSRTGRSAPVPVTGGVAFSELDQGALNSAATCGISTAGATWCWGGNTHGQLGSGVPSSRSAPVPVQFAGDFASLAAGGQVTCGTTAGPGTSYCWGLNEFGALGDGTITTRSLPTALAGVQNFSLISTSGLHTCGLDSASAPWCWGFNQAGQLGDATSQDRYVPTAASGALTFTQVAVGLQHSCGLTAAGAAYCWGVNQYGQLGDATTTSRNVPTAVAGGFTFETIGVGSQHTCARTDAGVAYCWGLNNSGALGDNTTTDRTQPAAVAGGKTFSQLSAGDGYTCGLAAAGAAWCWGANGSGQLGDGTTSGRTQPTAVLGGLNLVQIAAGSNLTCGRTSAGAAWCWGANGLGQLGGGTRTESVVSSPQVLVGGLQFQALTAATNHACGVASDGTGYCWGSNGSGQLGTGTGVGVVLAPAQVVR